MKYELIGNNFRWVGGAGIYSVYMNLRLRTPQQPCISFPGEEYKLFVYPPWRYADKKIRGYCCYTEQGLFGLMKAKWGEEILDKWALEVGKDIEGTEPKAVRDVVTMQWGEGSD